MFADLSGFRAMTEHRDAEEDVVLAHGCLAHISECVYRYDGTMGGVSDSLPDQESRRHMLGTPAAAKLHTEAEPHGQYGS
jgi:class 3 adenylate cyclase